MKQDDYAAEVKRHRDGLVQRGKWWLTERDAEIFDEEESRKRIRAQVLDQVGGSLASRGAHMLILDDTTKDDEEAQSQTIRDQVRSWFTKVA